MVFLLPKSHPDHGIVALAKGNLSILYDGSLEIDLLDTVLCAHCGEESLVDVGYPGGRREDSCLGNLDSVVSACCGHADYYKDHFPLIPALEEKNHRCYPWKQRGETI